MNRHRRYLYDVVEVAHALHMAATDNMCTAEYEDKVLWLQERLDNWGEGPNTCAYDKAVKAMVIAALEETNWLTLKLLSDSI